MESDRAKCTVNIILRFVRYKAETHLQMIMSDCHLLDVELSANNILLSNISFLLLLPSSKKKKEED